MDAKDFLKRVKLLDSQIETTMAEIVTLEAIAEKTTQVLGGERVQTSSSQDRMADCVAKIVDLKKNLESEVSVFADYRRQVRELVSKACDADCHKLIHKRYIGIYDGDSGRIIFKTWEQIAVEMGFTYQYVTDKLHKRALSQVQKELDRRKEVENG